MAEKLSVLIISRPGYAFNRRNFLSFCLKPLQVKCFEYLLKDKDICAVLPTGFGKSLCAYTFQTPRDFSVDEFPFVSPARLHERLYNIKGEALKLLRTNSSQRTFACKMELASLHDFYGS